MKYKNVLMTFLLIAGLLVVASLAMAEDITPATSTTNDDSHTSSRGGEMKDRRAAIVSKIQDIKKSVDDRKTAVTDLKKKIGAMGRIVEGTVTAINGSTFTIKNNDKMLTVTTDANTKCARHYFGTCALSEIAVNDRVNVWGTFTDDSKTTLLAKEIRDGSIMKVHGIFLGDVTSKTDISFVINSKERGSQAVTFSSATKFVQRDEQPSTYAALQVGNRLMVSGVWDKANNTVSEVTRVKNFSVPVKVPRMPPVATSPATTNANH